MRIPLDSGKHINKIKTYIPHNSAAQSRFFIDPQTITDGYALIKDVDSNHIKNVLRLKKGDRVILCDGAGNDHICELSDFFEAGARAKICATQPSCGEPRIKVKLWQSVPRYDKFEWAIQKCVEAGVYEIVPVISAHTQFIGKNIDKSETRKLERWNKISYEAAKQSGRGRVPVICGLTGFDEALDLCCNKSGSYTLIAYEKERSMTLKAALQAVINVSRDDFSLNIFVGPEGGFDADEVDAAVNRAATPVTLGPRIFRAETAGLAAICSVMYEYET